MQAPSRKAENTADDPHPVVGRASGIREANSQDSTGLRNMQQLMAWFAEGKVRPVVSERFPLARAPEAMRRLLDRQVKGKVVILPE